MDFDKFLFIIIILAEKRGHGTRLVHSHRMSMDITSCIEDMDLNLLSLFGMNCSEEIGMEMMDKTHIDDDLCHLPLHCLLLIFAHLLDVKLLTEKERKREKRGEEREKEKRERKEIFCALLSHSLLLSTVRGETALLIPSQLFFPLSSRMRSPPPPNTLPFLSLSTPSHVQHTSHRTDHGSVLTITIMSVERRRELDR